MACAYALWGLFMEQRMFTLKAAPDVNRYLVSSGDSSISLTLKQGQFLKRMDSVLNFYKRPPPPMSPPSTPAKKGAASSKSAARKLDISSA
jgi:hypothetical protein